MWTFRRRPAVVLSCLLALSLGLGGWAAPGKPHSLTGSYSRSDASSLDIQMLPKGRIKFHLVALWSSRFNRDAPHTGEVSGIVPLRANRAVYQTDGGQILMRFSGSRIFVVQKGDIPDFGMNVRADGVYRKESFRSR